MPPSIMSLDITDRNSGLEVSVEVSHRTAYAALHSEDTPTRDVARNYIITAFSEAVDPQDRGRLQLLRWSDIADSVTAVVDPHPSLLPDETCFTQLTMAC